MPRALRWAPSGRGPSSWRLNLIWRKWEGRGEGGARAARGAERPRPPVGGTAAARAALLIESLKASGANGSESFEVEEEQKQPEHGSSFGQKEEVGCARRRRRRTAGGRGGAAAGGSRGKPGPANDRPIGTGRRTGHASIIALVLEQVRERFSLSLQFGHVVFLELKSNPKQNLAKSKRTYSKDRAISSLWAIAITLAPTAPSPELGVSLCFFSLPSLFGNFFARSGSR